MAGGIRNDYGYDVNGNLVTDLNKRLSGTTGLDLASGGAITYNYLNLPSVITVKNADGSSKGTITYIYDAAGNKLEKRTNEVASGYNNNTAKQTTTSYLGDFVYENNVLQFFGQEEGRVRYKADNNTYLYDYFLKDHLGNVRMVLTDEVDPASIYQATMEDANRAFEDQLFNNIAQTVTSNNKPSGFDTDGNNKNVSELFSSSAGDKRIGPGIVLKVMAGDKFKAFVDGWYQPGTNSTVYSGAPSIVTALITAMSGGLVGSGSKGTLAELSSPTGVLSSPVGSFISDPSRPYTATVPKAYLNWMVLDEEQFKLVQGSYGAVQIQSITGTMQKVLMQANNGNYINITKNGYLYVYVSNESQGSVYFDDLRIEHTKGPLLEETHYYPFGLTMAGISSKAALGLENKYRWNKGSELQNKEFSDGSGLELYETKYRSLDPQIGRFWQIDPIDGLTQNGSLYAYSENNPISFTDALGLYKDSIRMSNGELAYANQPWLDAVVITKKKNFNWLGWPNNINTKNIKIWDYDKNLAIRRQENGELLIQGGESENYLKKIDWYKQLYKSDQDYRVMSLASVLILASPIIVQAIPELGAELKSLSEIETVKDVERINDIRAKVSEIIVRILSKYKLAPYSVMKGILNGGREYKSALELFESVQKFVENVEHIRDFIQHP